MAASNSVFHANWTAFIKSCGHEWPTGEIGDGLQKLFEIPTGMKFHHEYVKCASTWFGTSSSLRIKLFHMISYALDLFPEDFMEEADFKRTIENIMEKDSHDIRFLQKWFMRPSTERMEKDRLNMLIAEERKMEERMKQGKTNAPHVAETKSQEDDICMGDIRFIVPPHFLLFVIMEDSEVAMKKLTPKEMALFDIMEELDKKEGLTFGDLDFCLEAVDFYVHVLIVTKKLKLRYLNVDKSERPTPQEINKSMMLNLIHYARCLQQNLVYHWVPIPFENIVSYKQKLIDSVERVNEVLTNGKEIKDVPGITLKEKTFIPHMRVNIDLEKNAIAEMEKEQGVEQPKDVYHIIQQLYFFINALVTKKIGVNDLTITVSLYEIDKRAAFSFLFALNTAVTSVRDWWMFYESMMITVKRLGEAAEAFINPPEEEGAATSGQS